MSFDLWEDFYFWYHDCTHLDDHLNKTNKMFEKKIILIIARLGRHKRKQTNEKSSETQSEAKTETLESK